MVIENTYQYFDSNNVVVREIVIKIIAKQFYDVNRTMNPCDSAKSGKRRSQPDNKSYQLVCQRCGEGVKRRGEADSPVSP